MNEGREEMEKIRMGKEGRKEGRYEGRMGGSQEESKEGRKGRWKVVRWK